MEDLFTYEKAHTVRTKDKMDIRTRKAERRQELRVTTRDDVFRKLMKDVGGFPNKNEYLAIKTNGTSDCGSIFTYALNTWGEIEDMYLATWTISKANIKRLRDALDSGRLRKLTIVFSDTLKPANPALYAGLVGAMKGRENVALKEVNSHAKTFSIKYKDQYITVSGSANWSENPRIENFLIINDENLYEHHKQWMSELTTA